MSPSKITQQRSVNQQLVNPRFTSARDLVAWMGAMQAQEYAMARWAIGLRVPGLTDSAIEAAFNQGEILRTHVLRPTWHFVAPEDIRWLVALAAPQINSVSAYVYRQAGLDEKTFKRSNAILVKSLKGGHHLTRSALQEQLRLGKIIADGPRLSCLMIRAEIDGIICSGPRQGNQFTYALLDERVKSTPLISRDQALARLAEKFFRSRGPATVHDFAYWSGLSIKDSRTGTASLSNEFVSEEFLGKRHFFVPIKTPSTGAPPTFLMPEYDEYGMSYKNRGAMWAVRPPAGSGQLEAVPRRHCLVVGGEFSGWWHKDPKTKRAVVDPTFIRSLSKPRRKAVDRAIDKYNAFVLSSCGALE